MQLDMNSEEHFKNVQNLDQHFVKEELTMLKMKTDRSMYVKQLNCHFKLNCRYLNIGA